MKFSQLGLLGSVAMAAIAAGGYIVYANTRRRTDPEVLRRRTVSTGGRMIEGTVTDVHSGVVVYQWTWRGVDYEASQDLRPLGHLLPEREDALIGPVTVKFLVRDPANSIVMSETWTGFRSREKGPPSGRIEPS